MFKKFEWTCDNIQVDELLKEMHYKIEFLKKLLHHVTTIKSDKYVKIEHSNMIDLFACKI